MFEHITASEVAGYGVGALLLCATISATKIDSLIAGSQRSSLDMCKRCGDLRLIACSRCRGSGLTIQGEEGPLGSAKGFLIHSPLRMMIKSTAISCTNCQARGHFCCPTCSSSSAPN